MTLDLNQIKIFLPQYLSPKSQNELLSSLKSFPLDIDFYTDSLKNTESFYQGDAIKDILFVKIPDFDKSKKVNAILLSNTCDMDINNKRLFSSNILYTPLINFQNYVNLLSSKGLDNSRLKNHIKDLKNQLITQIMFFPSKNNGIPDSLIFLDNICCCANDYFNSNFSKENRIFTLNNYGAYLLLLKISIHFTRLTDNVDRVTL